MSAVSSIFPTLGSGLANALSGTSYASEDTDLLGVDEEDVYKRQDNTYGGRLPYHVRVLWDEAANTGQVPGLEKIVAVIRSREISLTLFYQAMSQCKALYKDHSETIMGNMDSIVFLGGRELMTTSEITTMPGDKCILQLRGLPPFLSPVSYTHLPKTGGKCLWQTIKPQKRRNSR